MNSAVVIPARAGSEAVENKNVQSVGCCSLIENAVDVLGSERIFFGSDYPWGSLLSNVYTIIDAEIPDSDKRQILANNFMRFFGRFKK